MKNVFKLCFTVPFAALLLPLFISAQTGGGFDLSHNVIASGGGTSSTGSGGGQTFTIDGTVGQGIAGIQSSGTSAAGSQFSVRGGFWAFQAAIPTAAAVSVGGRILTGGGNPVSKAYVVFTGTTGAIRIAVSNPFGYYRFDEVDVGQVYVIEVRSKRFQFVPQVVMVLDELSDLNFVALP